MGDKVTQVRRLSEVREFQNRKCFQSDKMQVAVIIVALEVNQVSIEDRVNFCCWATWDVVEIYCYMNCDYHNNRKQSVYTEVFMHCLGSYTLQKIGKTLLPSDQFHHLQSQNCLPLEIVDLHRIFSAILKIVKCYPRQCNEYTWLWWWSHYPSTERCKTSLWRQ